MLVSQIPGRVHVAQSSEIKKLPQNHCAASGRQNIYKQIYIKPALSRETQKNCDLKFLIMMLRKLHHLRDMAVLGLDSGT